MLNVPFAPATPLCATTCASPSSTSPIESVPPVLIGALLSSKVLVSELTVAKSLVPMIVTFTVPLAVPSWLTTVNWSLITSPAFNSSNAEFAV